jgi:hypothetical protein
MYLYFCRYLIIYLFISLLILVFIYLFHYLFIHLFLNFFICYSRMAKGKEKKIEKKSRSVYAGCIVHLHGNEYIPYLYVENTTLVSKTETLSQVFSRKGESPPYDMAFMVGKRAPPNSAREDTQDHRRSTRIVDNLVKDKDDKPATISVICRVDEGNYLYTSCDMSIHL